MNVLTAPTPRPLQIVVGIDFSDLSTEVLGRAIELAVYEGSVVHVVHLANQAEHKPGPNGCVHCATLDAMRRLIASAATLPNGDARIIQWQYLHSDSGSPAEDIIRFAARVDADYIVLGTHGLHPVKDLVLGSVTERLLRDAHCPVVIVRPKTHDRSELIEPPCPDCVATQQTTQGLEMWCERHSRHHVRGHFVAHDTAPDTSPANPWGFDAP